MCKKCQENPEIATLGQFSKSMSLLADYGLLSADPGLALVSWLLEHYNPGLTGATFAATIVRLREPLHPDAANVDEILLQDVAEGWEEASEMIPAPVLALVVPFLNFSLAEDLDGVSALWEEICKYEEFQNCVYAILALMELFHAGVRVKTGDQK